MTITEVIELSKLQMGPAKDCELLIIEYAGLSYLFYHASRGPPQYLAWV